MKEMTAIAGSRDNPVWTRVQLNNVDDNAPLTPDIARRAARVAFGHAIGVTVSDGRITYRLNPSGARRILTEPEDDPAADALLNSEIMVGNIRASEVIDL